MKDYFPNIIIQAFGECEEKEYNALKEYYHEKKFPIYANNIDSTIIHNEKLNLIQLILTRRQFIRLKELIKIKYRKNEVIFDKFINDISDHYNTFTKHMSQQNIFCQQLDYSKFWICFDESLKSIKGVLYFPFSVSTQLPQNPNYWIKFSEINSQLSDKYKAIKIDKIKKKQNIKYIKEDQTQQYETIIINNKIYSNFLKEEQINKTIDIYLEEYKNSIKTIITNLQQFIEIFISGISLFPSLEELRLFINSLTINKIQEIPLIVFYSIQKIGQSTLLLKKNNPEKEKKRISTIQLSIKEFYKDLLQQFLIKSSIDDSNFDILLQNTICFTYLKDYWNNKQIQFDEHALQIKQHYKTIFKKISSYLSFEQYPICTEKDVYKIIVDFQCHQSNFKYCPLYITPELQQHCQNIIQKSQKFRIFQNYYKVLNDCLQYNQNQILELISGIIIPLFNNQELNDVQEDLISLGFEKIVEEIFLRLENNIK